MKLTAIFPNPLKAVLARVAFARRSSEQERITLVRGDSVGKWAQMPRAFNAPASHQYAPDQFVDYPMIVCIETAASCNADCSFCAYGRIARKHARLPTRKVYEILDELKEIPHGFNLQFTGLSESLVDKRAQKFYEYAAKNISKATISIYTNGALLNRKNREWLCRIPVRHLSVSLNETDPQRYFDVMKLNFDKTIDCLDGLHGEFPEKEMRVDVTRVGDGSDRDKEFFEFVNSRYPKFNSVCNEEFTWLGNLDDARSNRNPAADLPCKQWYAARVHGDGQVTLCNQDDEAHHAHGNIFERPLLEIYKFNRFRAARHEKTPRKELPYPCNECQCMRQGSLPF